MWNKIAKSISIILHPYLVPTYIVLIILGTDSVFALYPLRLKFYMLWVSMLYSLILPLITYEASQFIGRNPRYGFLRRNPRCTALIVSTCCYTLGAINFMGRESLGIFFEIATIGLCCCVIMLLCLKWWRISPHMIAVGAAITFLTTLNIIGRSSHLTALLTAILLTGCLASARLYLGHENQKQVAWSLFAGIVACVITLLI